MKRERLRIWLDPGAPITAFLLGVALSGGDVMAAARALTNGAKEVQP